MTLLQMPARSHKVIDTAPAPIMILMLLQSLPYCAATEAPSW